MSKLEIPHMIFCNNYWIEIYHNKVIFSYQDSDEIYYDMSEILEVLKLNLDDKTYQEAVQVLYDKWT